MLLLLSEIFGHIYAAAGLMKIIHGLYLHKC